MLWYTTLAILATCSHTVLGHGYLVTPPSRKGGPAYTAACGSAIAARDQSDYTQEVQTLGTSPMATCDLFLCKGYQFTDVPPTEIQTYAVGQNVTFRYDVTIPHPGNDPTNITIIDMAARKVISPNLFLVSSLGSLVTKFDITFNMPKQVPDGKCKTPGSCVLALNWDAKDINQTFQSCVDFVLQQ